MVARSVRHICRKTPSSFCKRLIFITKWCCFISMQQPNCLTDQWLGYTADNLATILSTECVHRRRPGWSTTLPKKSARKKCSLNSSTLCWIRALANNLFHKICEEDPEPSGRDYTRSRVRRGALCTSRVCLKIGLGCEC